MLNKVINIKNQNYSAITISLEDFIKQFPKELNGVFIDNIEYEQDEVTMVVSPDITEKYLEAYNTRYDNILKEAFRNFKSKGKTLTVLGEQIKDFNDLESVLLENEYIGDINFYTLEMLYDIQKAHKDYFNSITLEVNPDIVYIFKSVYQALLEDTSVDSLLKNLDPQKISLPKIDEVHSFNFETVVKDFDKLVDIIPVSCIKIHAKGNHSSAYFDICDYYKHSCKLGFAPFQKFIYSKLTGNPKQNDIFTKLYELEKDYIKNEYIAEIPVSYLADTFKENKIAFKNVEIFINAKLYHSIKQHYDALFERKSKSYCDSLVEEYDNLPVKPNQ